MREHGRQRVLLSLAMSACILCLTNRYTGSLFAGLGRLAILVACFGLLLFVVHQVPTLYRLAVACAICMAWLRAWLPMLRFSGMQESAFWGPSQPLLLRACFQRPPPYLFL